MGVMSIAQKRLDNLSWWGVMQSYGSHQSVKQTERLTA